MRENRTCGSEGGEAQSLPYPYPVRHFYTEDRDGCASRATELTMSINAMAQAEGFYLCASGV